MGRFPILEKSIKMKDEKIGLSALARNEMSYPMVKMFWDSAGMEAMRR